MIFEKFYFFNQLRKLLNFGERHSFLSSFFLGFSLNFALSPFGIWMILPLSITPFLIILDSASNFKRLFWIGFFYYLGYFAGGLYWITIALSVDWSRFFWLFPFSFLGIPIALAFLSAPTVYALWIFKNHPNLKIFLFAGSIFIFDLMRTYIFPQFPWNLLGYTLASSPWFLQSTALFGVFGLGLFALFLGAFPYLLLKKTTRHSGIFVCIFLSITFFAGGVRLLKNPSQSTSLSLCLIQPNIPQTLKWVPSFRKTTLERLHTLSTLATSSSPKNFSLLVIWPETAVPLFLEEEEVLRRQLTSFLPPNALLITGGGRRTSSSTFSFVNSTSPPQQKIWNSLFVLDPEGKILNIYDKVHLVPFGEYVPFRKALQALSVSHFIDRTLDFSEGEGLQNVYLPNYPPFSPLICYEIAFPHHVLNSNFSRPEWILNITNDAWFGTSTGPYQHLQMAQVRACEEGLPVVRVANTGISAIIDPCGRFLNLLPLNQTGTLRGLLPKSLPPSFYARYGNWSPLFLLLIFGTFMGISHLCTFLFKKKKEKLL
ncbi:MAG: apolipoprotein N-acyltransferase [Alphaproteobacteria bacterium 16-39-46]|nr:MAG: apolipoprotein N-acyltransferase [Alphaproteobacteria bacterium 16-39-46]OZA43860.1 MAG: apolipoprotein N-acyltransferase [Alphaproteobacteria bacterium 17-39-52]HQS84101.1 apolipoprotein N-acyltransferase [Alphaproteobacteria bacterium]HQS93975.1 apolipoprotein N-acyltransferase [Alphaproteobacteria bacterium]